MLQAQKDYKNKFPDEASVEVETSRRISTFTQKVVAQMGHLESRYEVTRKKQGIGGFLLISGILGMYTPDSIIINVTESVPLLKNYVEPIVFFTLALSVALIAYGATLIKKGLGVITEFNKELNELVFAEVFSMFTLSGSEITPSTKEQVVENESKYTWKDYLAKKQFFNKQGKFVVKEHEQTLKLLNDSELVTEPRNQILIDNMFQVSIQKRPLFISELNIKHVTGGVKNRREKQIFYGYFASFELPYTLKGKTFVSTENDKSGFGHTSFWKTKKR